MGAVIGLLLMMWDVGERFRFVLITNDAFKCLFLYSTPVTRIGHNGESSELAYSGDATHDLLGLRMGARSLFRRKRWLEHLSSTKHNNSASPDAGCVN